MIRTLKSGLTIGLLAAALAMTGGCGDNDNSTNGNDNTDPFPTRTPGAVRTATPTPGASVGVTATPTPSVGTPATVDFDLTVTSPVQGFRIAVGYPTSKGTFEGTAETANCTTASGGTFVPNDDDNGTLILVLGNAVNLTFPLNIECTFIQNATEVLTASDLTPITVTEVTQNGTVGDPTVMTVTPTVSQPQVNPL